MPAVPLPPMNAAKIRLPSPPADPPTLDDITSARRYISALDECQRLAVDGPAATHDDLSNAQVYLHALCDRRARGEAAPAVSAASFRQIFREELSAALSEALRPLQELLEENLRVARGGGKTMHGPGALAPSLKLVPFTDADGTEIAPATFGLPALRSAADIAGLSDADLNTYMREYDIPRQGNLSRTTKLRRLREFVGCPADA